MSMNCSILFEESWRGDKWIRVHYTYTIVLYSLWLIIHINKYVHHLLWVIQYHHYMLILWTSASTVNLLWGSSGAINIQKKIERSTSEVQPKFNWSSVKLQLWRSWKIHMQISRVQLMKLSWASTIYKYASWMQVENFTCKWACVQLLNLSWVSTRVQFAFNFCWFPWQLHVLNGEARIVCRNIGMHTSPGIHNAWQQ